MSETIDPITVLRDYFINKKEITVNTKAASGDDNVELVFGDSGIKLPRKVKTAWQRKDGKDYYNVGDIYFWLANSHLKPLEYMRDAQGQGFQVIQMNDRQEIQTYFSGASNSSNQIDEQYRPQTLIKKSHLRSSRAVPVANLQGQAGQVLMRKRDAKAEEKIQQKMKVFEHLLQNERKISSRATAIQSQNRSFLKVLQLAYQMTGQEKKVQEVKERIEKRQGKCIMVNLDVGCLQDKTKRKQSLLEEIIKGNKQDRNFSRGARQKPIIIVPASLYPGNISISNAVQFLQEGQYQANPNQQQLSQDNNNLKTEVTHTINGEKVVFEIHDNVQSFTDEKWKRVVAVFVNGFDWQFKDWPIQNQSKMVDLFLRVRGYFLHFADQTTQPEFAKKWSIKILQIHRNKRHQDISIYNEFWADIENHLKKERYPASKF